MRTVTETFAAVLLLGDFGLEHHRELLRRVAEAGHIPLAIGSGPAAADNAVLDAAEFADLSGFHTAEIIDRAATWSARHAIRAVFPLDDEYVEAAAWIADLLAIPGPGLRAAVAARGEGRGAQLPPGYLDAWTPRTRLVPPKARTETAAAWTAFPALLKQVGRSAGQTASRSSRVVHDTQDLLAAFAAAGANLTLLVEEQPLGEECVVESLSVRGQIAQLEATGGDVTQLAETHAAVLRRLAFESGVAHAHYRRLPGKQPTLIAFGIGPSRDVTSGAVDRLAQQISLLLQEAAAAHLQRLGLRA